MTIPALRCPCSSALSQTQVWAEVWGWGLWMQVSAGRIWGLGASYLVPVDQWLTALGTQV